MSRIATIGFELNSTTTGMESDTFSGVTVSSSIFRSGAYALRANAAASAPFWRTVLKSADDSTNICYFRFYLYIASSTNALVQIARIVDSGNVQQCTVRLNTDNTLQLTSNTVTQVGSSSAALSTSTWYRVEVSFNPSTGAISARINGTEFASGSSATGSWSRVLLGAINGTPTCDLYFDDVAINDSAGSVQNSWPGDGKVVYLRPNAAGDNTQWGLGAGSGSNYELVDEVTPNDNTDYVRSRTTGHLDDYNLEAFGNSGATINVLHVGFRATRSSGTTSSGAKVRLKASSGGTVSESAEELATSSSWRTNDLDSATPLPYPLTSYTKPGTSDPWTPSDVDSAQIGLNCSTGSGDRYVHVTAMWLVVDYTPGTPPSSQIKKLLDTTQATLKVVAGVAIAGVKKVAGVANS